MSKRAMLLTAFLVWVVAVSVPEASWGQGLLPDGWQYLYGTPGFVRPQILPPASSLVPPSSGFVRPGSFPFPTSNQNATGVFPPFFLGRPLPPGFRPIFLPFPIPISLR